MSIGPSISDPTLVQPDGPGAQLPQLLQLVRDQDQRAAPGVILPQALEAALPERLVADGEHLVEQQDVGLEADRDREGEPGLHARRSST